MNYTGPLADERGNPLYSRSFSVATNELTLTDIKRFRKAAADAGAKRALDLGIAADPRELLVREAEPHTDFAATWLTEYYVEAAGPAAVGWQLVGDAVPRAASQLAVDKVAVFYKIADAANNPAVTAVRFRVGPTGATTLGSFFTQLPIDNKLEPDVYLTIPIVYSPQQWVFIEAYWRAGGVAAGEELDFGCFIIEPTGGVVS
jgi:hypothetical protein